MTSQTVYVVDDDSDVRRSVSFMLSSADISAHPFASGADLLEEVGSLTPGCVLLDLRMPQVDGFQVMTELKGRGIDWPVIVMTGHGEVPLAVRAMKAGAIDFLEKPFGEDALLACFSEAFALLEERQRAALKRQAARERLALLTGRESEVLGCLISGMSNKVIAKTLGISLRTVEMHRGNMMARLEVGSLAEALALAFEAGFEGHPAQAA